MPTFDDPSPMTADERLAEVAAILAASIVRLRARAALPPAVNPLESAFHVLELRSKTSLSDHDG